MKFKLPFVSGEPEISEVSEHRPGDMETPGGVVSNEMMDQKPDLELEKDEEGNVFEPGIQAAKAMTETWTRQHLVIAYLLIWILSFVQAFSSGIISTMSVYVTSSFEMHSLTPTISIVASVMSGLLKLPYAKLMNIWGRPQAFGLMIVCITMGIVMMAACNNVNTYAAAQVFYNIGYTGLDFTTTIFIADTSSLKSRAFMIAFSSSPYLATVWAYGPAAQSALEHIGFRWGIGMWAIIYPIATLPLFSIFYFNQRKAEKMGLVHREPHNRNFSQNFIHYLKEFDVFGIFLLAAGLALFLLALAIYSYQSNTWRSPLIICFLVFGGLLVIAFCLWEKYLAPVTFIPWVLIKNRTVIFTYTMVASIYCAWYIWDSYFYSFLIVVFNESIAHATYITSIYTVGSCFIALVMGVIIRINGRIKWQALFFGFPLTALGVGLMIHFRQTTSHVGFIVMCQIFIAFGGGILVICEQMTVMAVSSRQNIPQLLAMEGLVAYVSGGIGQAIAAAMWTGIFPNKLAQYLPADAQDQLYTIYGDITVQSSYAIGSPTRDGINHAYGDTQRLMLITATSLYVITFVSILMWQDVNVKKIKQVTGVVW